MVLLSTEKKIGVGEIQSLLRLEDENGAVPAAERMSSADAGGASAFRNADGSMKKFDEIEKAAVEEAIAASGCNITAAAEMLGLSRKTMHNKIRQYSIRIQKKVDRD
jgi:DNA-binding NtrC family response regulator